MRFAATHKAVSYLMVTTAFVMLMLTGELPLAGRCRRCFSSVVRTFSIRSSIR